MPIQDNSHIKFVPMNDKEWAVAFVESFDEALLGGFFDLANDLLEDARHKIPEKDYYACSQKLLLAKEDNK